MTFSKNKPTSERSNEYSDTPLFSFHLKLEGIQDSQMDKVTLFETIDSILNKMLSKENFSKILNQNKVNIQETDAKEEKMSKMANIIDFSQMTDNLSDLFQRTYQYNENGLTVEFKPKPNQVSKNFQNNIKDGKKRLEIAIFIGSLHPIVLIGKIFARARTQEILDERKEEILNIYIKKIANVVGYITQRYIRQTLELGLSHSLEENMNNDEEVSKQIKLLHNQHIKMKI